MNEQAVAEFNRRLNKGFRCGESNGWCTCDELFSEILKAFPQAPVEFTIRNFTMNKVVRVVQVNVPMMGDANRAYYNHADISEFFPELNSWGPVKDRIVIPIETFIAEGPTVAKILKREFTIRHQYGSGRQELASFKKYGPFKP